LTAERLRAKIADMANLSYAESWDFLRRKGDEMANKSTDRIRRDAAATVVAPLLARVCESEVANGHFTEAQWVHACYLIGRCAESILTELTPEVPAKVVAEIVSHSLWAYFQRKVLTS
jgi:hypothetical protein